MFGIANADAVPRVSGSYRSVVVAFEAAFHSRPNSLVWMALAAASVNMYNYRPIVSQTTIVHGKMKTCKSCWVTMTESENGF